MSKIVENFDPGLIFNQLAHNSDYFYKVFPHLEKEFFSTEENVIYQGFKKHFDNYEQAATPDILRVYIDDIQHINSDLYDSVSQYLKEKVNTPANVHFDWMLECTEDFCANKKLYNALAKSVSIYDSPTPEYPISSIPDLIQEALSVSFDAHIGTDYYGDALERFKRMKYKGDKLPFLSEQMNRITKGGFERKTVNAILASTGVGKSAYMCVVKNTKVKVRIYDE